MMDSINQKIIALQRALRCGDFVEALRLVVRLQAAGVVFGNPEISSEDAARAAGELIASGGDAALRAEAGDCGQAIAETETLLQLHYLLPRMKRSQQAEHLSREFSNAARIFARAGCMQIAEGLSLLKFNRIFARSQIVMGLRAFRAAAGSTVQALQALGYAWFWRLWGK